MRIARLPKPAALLTVAALVLSGCGFSLYSAPLPGGADLGGHPYTLTAQFADVLDLVPNSAVRVNDVPVGKITSVSLVGWHAKVTMEVNGSVRLPGNARAQVAQTSLLGEKYVALMGPLGVKGRGHLHDGSAIPLSDTQSAPDTEEVLGALSLLLNQGGLAQIRVIATELNGALRGNEPAIRDLIGRLNTFVGTLNSQKTKITNALDSIDTLTKTLNRQKTVLTDALDTYPAALRVLSTERGKLTGLLSSLSHLGTVARGVINKTQGNLVSTLKELKPTLKGLTAAGDSLPKALKILGTFPFPLNGTSEFVRGDYANLAADLNLNLGQELCGVLGGFAGLQGLCSDTTVLGGGSTGTGTGSATSVQPGQIIQTQATYAFGPGVFVPTTAALSALSSYKPIPLKVALRQFLPGPGFARRTEAFYHPHEAAHQFGSRHHYTGGRTSTLSRYVFTRSKYKPGKALEFTHGVPVVPTNLQHERLK